MIETFQRLHTGRLVLTPVAPMRTPDPEALRAALASGGLLGTALDETAGRYAAGPRLLELIGFTGCAVQLDTNTTGSGNAVHIRIDGPHPQPILKQGRNSRPPRCPACMGALPDWREQRAGWPHDRTPMLRCGRCGKASPAWDWDWRRHAGFGRVFVCIEEVFPGEGQPLPGLLDLLNDLGAGPWRHFFVQD